MTDAILPCFQVTETLHEGANSLVYRVLSEVDGRTLVIKMLEEIFPSPEKIAWFQREYETTRSLSDLDGVVDAYELRNEQDRWFILLEDFGGTSISQFLRGRRTIGDEFLNLAVPIVEILAQIHHRNIIHKDINPSNIVLNPASGEVKLIDFGISTVLSQENPDLRDPSRLEGTLAYLSPEQTGRMNRAIDYRADFYSLGVTFYELTTGKKPFETSDPLELVHSHIARRPTAPHELDSKVDSVLSDLIMKLLAKSAEDRYQSAHGILRDLEMVRRRWKVGESDGQFTLAQSDFSDRLQIPQKLYGREHEKRALLDAFEHVAAGACEMMLVSGYSGVGKSAIVREIYRPITRQRGYFIAGKFDQLQRDVPYAPLIQAFRRLMRQLLSESEERIQIWRQKLLETLGPNGQLIIDVIPEVEIIAGPQPKVTDLEPNEIRNRFSLAFQSFISVFSQPEHPLVLFVDDLQWVDRASLEILEALMTGDHIHHLFLIGAYRDNEVDDAHPLLLILQRLRDAGVNLTKIELQPLLPDHVEQLLADALKLAPEDAVRLGRIVCNKTGGNPFFLKEFLRFLYDEKLIRPNFEIGIWECSLEAIETCEVTENVVALLVDRVLKLNPSAQQVLKLAACTGHVFDLQTLAIISKKTPWEAAKDLWEAIAEGLVLPLDERYKLTDLGIPELLDHVCFEYKFAHDRIQQAAYSLIGATDRCLVHWQVGQLMLENLPEREIEHRVFDIVHQFDQGIDYAWSLSRRDELARLFLFAGQRAKASAAHDSALHYLKIGVRLLVSYPMPVGRDLVPLADEFEESWGKQYRFTLELFAEAAEAACLTGAYGEMDQLIQILLKKARSPLDKVRGYRIRIQSYAARQSFVDAIDTGRRALALLGVEIEADPSSETIGRVASEVKTAWSDLKVEMFVELPEMTDGEKLAAMDLMASLYLPAFNAALGVWTLVVFNEMILSINHGVTASSPRGFVAYGLILCSQGEIDFGYRFGEQAVLLADRYEGKKDQVRSSTVYMFNYFIRQWKEGLGETVDPLLQGYQIGLDSGDLEFACLNLCGVTVHSFWCGRDLREIAEITVGFSSTIARLKQEAQQAFVDMHRQVALGLLGRSGNDYSTDGEVFREEVIVGQWETANNTTAICYLYVLKLFVNYIAGQYGRAIECSRLAEEHIAGLVGQTGSAVFYFYDSLVRIKSLRDAGDRQWASEAERIEANQEKLLFWSRYAPMNFEHKYHLVAAEFARLLGNHGEARDLYDRAISLSRKHGFVQEEALAHELASGFHRDQDHAHLARNYLRDAHYAYQRWGALAKARELEERFPQDLTRTASRALPNLDGTHSASTAQEATEVLDLRSVLKASQALSGEIVFEKLLEKLLRTVIENAGAEKAALILDLDGKLVIQAQGMVDNPNMQVLEAIPVAEGRDVLRAAVNVVARTGEPVVLKDACNEGAFTNDPYVRNAQPKSILCMPLTNQGKTTAILYLENNLVTAAFTHERIELLNLLSAEMAIAIDNAWLYQELDLANKQLEAYSHELEDRVADRTRELGERNEELNQTLGQLRATQQQLVLQEKMASLGGLTAGIAHEIRNPLNFINNFARLSVEIAEEIHGEFAAWSESSAGDHLDEVQELLGDLMSNAGRIEEHGKRANSIVSSMLLHTQASGSERVLTDLNNLLSRSTQLAIHGMRAREASFNVVLEESYDDSIEAVSVVPQDISRVFINLIDNAISSTREKARQIGDAGTCPITIRTAGRQDRVAIVIRDQGLGISTEILDQIFDPFFTAKSVGTGLGLSISYDIVVNKHQGEILVDSEEGEYAEFTVILPRVTPASGPASS